MEKTMKELRAEAKAKEITVPFGATKEQLENLVSNGIVETKPTKETSKIPTDLQHLNLAKVKKFTKEDVNINHFAGRRKLLDVPLQIKEELKREGYEVIFPLDDVNAINELRALRGAEFVLNADGSSIKISAQQQNTKGELQYHIAMKIKKEFLEEERRQKQQKYLSKKQKVRSGEENLGIELGTDPSLMKFTNIKNKI